MKADIVVTSEVKRTARDMQASGMFDTTPELGLTVRWSHHLPVEDKPWQIGAVIGPSGCGKSTLARRFWPVALERYDELRADWPKDMSILNGFPKELSIMTDIIPSLSSVGFNSPPAWQRPFHVLSNGEQFRVMMARVLAESKLSGKLAVVDEFTSVVDRTVARIGSAALSKAIRRAPGVQFVAVTCHDDIVDWLQPDWVYYPAEQRFAWRSVQSRPPIKLDIYRTTHRAWRIFSAHHYLTHELNKAAFCFVCYATLDNDEPRLVGFDAWLPFFGKLKDERKARRGHRTVVLPDFQGVSIGAKFFKFNAALWKGLGLRAFSGTAHPAEIAARRRDRDWLMTRAPGMTAKGHHSIDAKRASDRMLASFEYVGAGLAREDVEHILNTQVEV